MPITTTVDHHRELTIHTGTGEVSFEELMTVLRKFWDGQPTKNVLWDGRTGETPNLSTDDIERMVDYVVPKAENRLVGKTALVVPRDLEYGLSRAANILHEIAQLPYQIGVFRSIEEAYQWLDEEG